MTDINCEVQGKGFLLVADALTIIDNKIVLVKRKYPPFKGYWAIPGGLVAMEETVEESALRELKEETGIDGEIISLVGVFSALDRDPRKRSVCICYHCKAKNAPLKSTEEAEEVRLFPMDALPELAFDHKTIISTFLCEDQEQ
ncbi:NUDIX hydrolase [archaeon]|nr:NUDIX hydrolase [archaeon]